MKGQEEIPGSIIVVGVIVLTFVIIGAAYVSIGNTRTPAGFDQGLVEEHEVEKMADLADRCWAKSGTGSSGKEIACFRLKIEPGKDIEREEIARHLESLPEEKLKAETVEKDTKSTLKISYSPLDEQVEVEEVEVCDPDEGDTCRDIGCGCETVCQPGLDTDGDGTPETDRYGCVSAADFRPESEPCTTCGVNPLDRREVQEELEVDLGGKLAYSEAWVNKTPVEGETEWKRIKVEGELFRASQRVVAEANDTEMALGKVRLPLEELDSGSYYTFFWVCNTSGSVPEECGWSEPRFFTIKGE